MIDRQIQHPSLCIRTRGSAPFHCIYSHKQASNLPLNLLTYARHLHLPVAWTPNKSDLAYPWYR